jgi:hypothetical protein
MTPTRRPAQKVPTVVRTPLTQALSQLFIPRQTRRPDRCRHRGPGRGVAPQLSAHGGWCPKGRRSIDGPILELGTAPRHGMCVSLISGSHRSLRHAMKPQPQGSERVYGARPDQWGRRPAFGSGGPIPEATPPLDHAALSRFGKHENPPITDAIEVPGLCDHGERGGLR